jgi:hypothetical protein
MSELTPEERVGKMASEEPMPYSAAVKMVDAIRKAEKRGYLRGLIEAKSAIQGGDYESECNHAINVLIQQAEAKE